VYTARKHHVPVWLTVTASESANDAGGLDPLTACVSTGLPTCVPPVGQAPPLVWLGLQMKNVTVPVGVPSPDWSACTIAWSLTWDPNVVVPPDPTDGVVVVVVVIVWTVKHSFVPLAPPNSVSVPG
jgi:hypothetical protein